MTDRDPNELYNALRSRLADYGQEPPEHLWAGIRQQLPPPVALPQRRRRRSAYVLLGLLLLVAGVASVIGWSRWGRPSPGRPELATTAGSARQQPASRPSPANGLQSPAANEVAVNSTIPPAAEQLNPRRSSLHYPDQAGAATADAAAAQGQRTTHRSRSSATPAASHPGMSAASLLAATTSRVKRLGSRKVATHSHEPAASAATAAALAATASRSSAAALEAATTATLAATSLPGAESSKGQAATRRAFLSRSKAARAGHATAAAQRASSRQSARAAYAAAKAAYAATAKEKRPTLRLVALHTLPAPTPTVEPGAAARRLPPLLVRRWSVQLLAGPALTYRQLGTQPSAEPGITPSTIRSVTNKNLALAELERPTLGWGMQLQLRRVLNGRWAVSSGLGYQEYATRFDLQQVSVTQPNGLVSVPTPPDSSTTSIHQRDTYRFVTLPLRLGYTWAVPGRWQASLLAGADLAFYVGGNSTEGSSCACQTQTWGPSDSPYRRFSLGASLGVDVRYRLASHWELVAQPTASYLLTSLPRPETNYSPRHLLGLSALLGVSYDLP
jgi:hypothetical protein